MTDYEKIFGEFETLEEERERMDKNKNFLESVQYQVNSDIEKRIKKTGETPQDVMHDLQFLEHIYYLLGMREHDSLFWDVPQELSLNIGNKTFIYKLENSDGNPAFTEDFEDDIWIDFNKESKT